MAQRVVKEQVYIVRAIGDAKQLKVVRDNLQAVQAQAAATGTSVAVSAKKFSEMSVSLGKIADRALVTIPIWFALRGAFVAMIDTLTLGITAFIQFEQEMLRVRAVMTGTSKDIEADIGLLSNAIRSMARETGESLGSLANAAREFATLGFDVGEVIDGLNASTKLSIVFQSDSGKTAESLAFAYRLLGDTIDQAIPPSKRLEAVAGSLVKLDQENRVVMDEFTESLRKFLSTANIMNISLEETIALMTALNTAGILSGRSGQLTKTAFFQLAQSLDTVQSRLKLAIDPGEQPFDTFKRIAARLKELQDEGRQSEVSLAIPDIFGGARGSEVISGLIAVFDQFQRNLKDGAITVDNFGDHVANLDARVKENLESIGRQTEIFGRLREEAGEALILGTDNGASTLQVLKDINAEMRENIIPGFRVLGDIIRGTFKALSNARELPEIPTNLIKAGLQTVLSKIQEAQAGVIEKAFRGQLSSEEIDELIVKLELLNQKTSGTGSFGSFKVEPLIERLQALQRGELQFTIEIDKANAEKQVEDLKKKAADPPIVIRVSDDTLAKIKDIENSLGAAQAAARGMGEVDQAAAKIAETVQTWVDRVNASAGAIKIMGGELEAQEVITAAMAGDWQKIAELSQNNISESQLQELAKLVAEFRKAQLQQVQAFTSDVKGSFKNLLIEGFEGSDGVLENFQRGLRRAILNAFATTVTDALFKGAFGGIIQSIGTALVGGFTSTLAAHTQGAAIVSTSILAAHTKGALIASQLKAGTASITGVAGQAAGGAALSGAGASAGGFAAFLANPIVGAAILALAVTASVIASRKSEKEQFKAAGIDVADPGLNGFQKIALGPQAVSALIGRDRDAAQHIGKEGSRTQFTSFLGAAGLAFNALTFKSRATQTTVEEFRIASKIDVTNKELQIVNRNLVALQNAFETFVLPTSSFFSEKPGPAIESAFSINSRRGLS